MITQLTPRTVRLFIYALCLFIIILVNPPLLQNQQLRNLRAIDEHIAKIAPQWDNFRATHPGFERVEFFSYTGGDGRFAASGIVTTESQNWLLREFMESTHPPRPVYLEMLRVTTPEVWVWSNQPSSLRAHTK